MGIILADLPRAALTDQNPQIMTFDMFSESIGLKGDTPSSKCVYLVADRNYPIDRREMVVGGLVSTTVCLQIRSRCSGGSSKYRPLGLWSM